MSTKLCRTFIHRNSSILSSPSNYSQISDAEWITNSISLIIFFFAFIGNTAAIIVMFGSRGPIRLTNNKYLANLACGDLLRACFMPFTIIARMKRNFIFGKMICKILPIVQGLSVAVDVFTLVCISIERYLAICRPLLVLKLQSIQFSNLLNALILLSIWLLGLLIAMPNLYMYNLCSLPKPGRFKCEKTSPQEFNEKLYMIALDVFYFVIPMAVMIVLYTLIIRKMYKNSTAIQMRSFKNSNSSKLRSNSSSPQLAPIRKRSRLISRNSDFLESQGRQSSIFERLVRPLPLSNSNKSRSACIEDDHIEHPELDISPKLLSQHTCEENHKSIKRGFQRSDSQKASSSLHRYSSSHGVYRMDRSRRKALKLLIVLIVEFFICWTPLFIYHTIGTFNKNFYRSMPNICLDLILLFSFASASCNPLTYYFMSKRYRSALYAYLRCCCFIRSQQNLLTKNQSMHNIKATINSNKKENYPDLKLKEHLHIDIYLHHRLRSKTY